jgi:hypothetical protein
MSVRTLLLGRPSDSISGQCLLRRIIRTTPITKITKAILISPNRSWKNLPIRERSLRGE